MSTFREQIEAIIADREHGSSTLVQWILDALAGNAGERPSPSQQRWALAELRRVNRSMVVVHHLLDALGPEPGNDLNERLRDYARRWSDIPERIARQLLAFRRWDDARVLLHSHSGMLRFAVSHVAQAAPGMRFWQTRASPGGEGVTQHRLLCEQGIDCTLLEDEQVPDIVPGIDAAWLGVDQFDAQCFVNKAGSESITRRMTDAGKPVLVLGDSRKQVRQVDYSAELFEAVPFGEGVHLVTEGGVFPTRPEQNEFFVTSQRGPV